MAAISSFSVDYMRRFRMELDFADVILPPPVLPDDFEFVFWRPGMADRHAAVKYASFRSEIDSHLFPSLGEAGGCMRLMQEISVHESFLSAATWLIHYDGPDDSILRSRDCATIQGMQRPYGVGAIQNVGVTPEHRGVGLGRALVLKALHGFRAAGLKRVYLEVTADNEPAVALYRSMGFRVSRTMFQAVDLEPEFA